ncbi:hypothetical protein FB45DRAFT_514710 [Roridomyces roridus]|uniref:Uncharacterized protein n=1 Tax=Roridomyces roridus TaxID=1738132 RepID=A0AAD7BX66_9AGAR|nr:hypothetical protein FB45DRAFT_514710 [Roridomyces roridus]
MPSLRRSYSSPSVRSAPYSPGPAPRGSGHRRSTGSETTIRRVLADIEWWRVADGQHEVPEQEAEEQDDLDPGEEQDLPEQVPADAVAVGAFASEQQPEMPVNEMAALSIAPTTPTRHALESSTSSLESSPDVSTVQAELPFLDLGSLNASLQDTDVETAFVGTRARQAALLSVRSYSFDFASHERQYADFAISPLSSPPIFSN